MVESSIDRIISVIDVKINKNYLFNEPNISVIAKAYIRKYLSVYNGNPKSQLKILCTTSYLIAMKYHLDSAPKTKDYSQIVNVPINRLISKEMELASQFLFNFTPVLD